jgi:hypothetical protein|tara:strand:- start:528 stop:797 length:270 start_codon:yes stop_codon:yes gene_type:complete
MKFINKFPKKEIKIEKTTKVGSLIADQKVVIHYRNYIAYLDKVNYITLTGEKNAWYEIKNDFLYDTLMNKVKEVYKDSFSREMTVNILK